MPAAEDALTSACPLPIVARGLRAAYVIRAGVFLIALALVPVCAAVAERAHPPPAPSATVGGAWIGR